MPFRLPVVSLIVAVGIVTLAITAHAQPAPPLWIQSVTVDAAAGTATITGTGFSETCAVTLDGHALTVLPGGTATRLVVVAPVALLATAGTYRLTVTDAVRAVGDAFEITIADRPEVGFTSGERSAPGARQTPTAPGVRAPQFVAPGELVGMRALIEDDVNGNAAFGSDALASNTSGFGNTAGGYHALFNNTTGSQNTALGMVALNANVSSGANTAVGYGSLPNLIGAIFPKGHNTSVGAFSLEGNTTGFDNTALGVSAGGAVTTGNDNIHIGAYVYGLAADTNTTRIGLPYYYNPDTPPLGQNRTFISGIRGTTVSGATPVGVTSDGQLGMADKLGAGVGYGCATCYQNGTIELYNPAPAT
jgi:hypothetical protein